MEPIRRSSPRLHEGTWRGDRHESGEHAVGHHARVGLAHPLHAAEHRDHGAERRSDGGVRRDHGKTNIRGGQRRSGVEPEPAEQQDERPEHRHRDVVSRERSRLSIRTELPDSCTEYESAREPGDATHCVDDARPRKVDVTETEVRAHAELGQPAAAPGPAAEDRVIERAAEQAPADERLPLPPLGHRSGGNRGGGVHERHHVKEESGDGSAVCDTAQAPPGTTPQEHPVPRVPEVDQAVRRQRLVEAEGARKAVAAEHDRETDHEERHESQSEDGEVRADDVGRVLRPAEAGLDEREPRLHENHQHRSDDDPEQVQAEGRAGPHGHLGVAAGRRIDRRGPRRGCPEDDECGRDRENADRTPFGQSHTTPPLPAALSRLPSARTRRPAHRRQVAVMTADHSVSF